MCTLCIDNTVSLMWWRSTFTIPINCLLYACYKTAWDRAMRNGTTDRTFERTKKTTYSTTSFIHCCLLSDCALLSIFEKTHTLSKPFHKYDTHQVYIHVQIHKTMEMTVVVYFFFYHFNRHIIIKLIQPETWICQILSTQNFIW